MSGVISDRIGGNAPPPIDWEDLHGTWECEKVMIGIGKDSKNDSSQCKSCINYYYPNSKYKEEFPAGKQAAEGTYRVNRMTHKIHFSDLTYTKKITGTKVAVADSVFKTGKSKLFIMELTKDRLVLLDKHPQCSEGPGDYVFYMKKVN